MNRKCEQSVTTDERRTFTKVLGADKDKVHRDQTVGNDNKDAMLDCKSGFHPSEDKLKRNILPYLCYLYHDYYISYVFAQTEYIISCYFSSCAIRFVTFLCILYSHVVQECLCARGIK